MYYILLFLKIKLSTPIFSISSIIDIPHLLKLILFTFLELFSFIIIIHYAAIKLSSIKVTTATTNVPFDIVSLTLGLNMVLF